MRREKLINLFFSLILVSHIPSTKEYNAVRGKRK